MTDGLTYRIVIRAPSLDEYCDLRVKAGLSPKGALAASRGLSGGLHAVVVEDQQGLAVGMGRVIGDGGCFFEVVDVAVLPAHQGKGLGKAVMTALMEWLTANAAPTATVTLLADGTAHRLYEKFGFVLSTPGSQGMILKIK